MLTGAETLDAILIAWERDPTRDLAERLMLALEAGDQVGGDFHGKQSAALKVMGREAYARVDLRVDEHVEPVAELAAPEVIAGFRETVSAAKLGNSQASPCIPQKPMICSSENLFFTSNLLSYGIGLQSQMPLNSGGGRRRTVALVAT